MSNNELWQEFLLEMKQLIKRVGTEEYMRIWEARIIDYFEKHRNADEEEVKRLIEQLAPPAVNNFGQKIMKQYNDIIELVNNTYGEEYGTDINRNFSKIKRIEEATQGFLGKFETGVKRKLRKAINEGFREKLDRREFTEKIKKVDNVLTQYADTISVTKLMQYGRTGKRESARIAGIEYYDYVGYIRVNTRPFCREMMRLSKEGKRWTIKELDELDNGKKQLKPVSQYCGGWHCWHDLEPDPFYKK